MAVGAALVLTAGCVAEPPPDDPIRTVMKPTIAAESSERAVRDFTVRVRNRGCPTGGVGTGSGIVLDNSRIVTNRHVIDGADELVVSSWDGQEEVVDVVAAATISDLAVVEVSRRLGKPAPLGSDPERGDDVQVAGYPQGNEFHASEGKVLGYDSETDPEEAGDVIAVDATVRGGNSGGPLLDSDGRLVGVVYAVRTRDSAGLAIPVSRLNRVLAQSQLEPVPACGTSYEAIDEIAEGEGVGRGEAPQAPVKTTTTTAPPYACPNGEPAAAVTGVRSVPGPTYFEGDTPFYDTYVDGSVTNHASAAVDFVSVEIEVVYGDGSTGSAFVLIDGSIPAGESRQFSEQAYGYGDGTPRVESVNVTWSWASIDDSINCP